jgi:cyclophilin family peptidyl-prolyl cis-trans isomerase|tara:strand:+ start:17170 stop:17895 length:726 start_codon:yes stop_codon:yes gene_type:complete
MLFTPMSKAEPSPMEQSYEGNPIVIINLTYEAGIGGGNDIDGEVVIELFVNWAPITVSNFIGLVNESFYNGIFFHRVIDDFVIQAGDDTCTTIGVYPASDPSCGSNGSDETIPFEANANLTHINGAVGMARGLDPDSASSQFYICDGPQHGLDNGNRSQEDDPGYAVFGVVREGMDLVQAVAQVPTSNDPMNRPLYEVHINSITLEGFVNSEIEEREDEKTSGIGFSLSILSIALVALRRN